MGREDSHCCGTGLCLDANNVDENVESARSSMQGLRGCVVLVRDHTWAKCMFMSFGLSMCITVDILQHSMPLAFLPSVLEDRGHSPQKISTAIGVYYYTGFAGCSMIMVFQIWKLLYGKGGNNDVTDYASAKRYVLYLIIGLAIGTVTLVLQALEPRLMMHTACRFVQGMAGSFIFFYTFLLSVELFQGQQQIFAMTAASCALNVAEVIGSFLGAVFFNYWGQRAVFWFLGLTSLANQVVLLTILNMMQGVESLSSSLATSQACSRSHTPRPPSRIPTPLVEDTTSTMSLEGSLASSREVEESASFWPSRPRRAKFQTLLENRCMNIASLLIVMAAIVKGSVEEMLPFHADHQWGYEPLKIGALFGATAVAYIIAAVLVGQFWCRLHRYQVCFSAYWLAMLGALGWCVFAVASYYKREGLLFAGLVFYGVGLGLTHTPAALLLAAAIEDEEGRSREVVNSIFNTMWEAGGSLGFLLGGHLAEHYQEQMSLMTAYAICCVLTAIAMLCIANWPLREPGRDVGSLKEKGLMTPSAVEKAPAYGTM
mmetsp:Transcript_115311/g.204343  ORF Transcript_115311/g.204343 Transcript_115311/m.204343 type:complete len:543 (+) Transcript_115311:57-1685(+)